MSSTYSELKFELIGVGEQSGIWGSTTNTNLGTAVEEAIAGQGAAAFPADADLTLVLANTPTAQIARNFRLMVTSAVPLSTSRNLIVPAIYKPYAVANLTTGGQSITVKNSTGTGVTVPNGKHVIVYNDGVNVVSMADYFPALSAGALNLSTPLALGDGGTGVGTLAAGVVTTDGLALSSIAQPAGALVGTTATQTLTNKAVQLRVSINTDVPFITPDANDHDMFVRSAQVSSLAFQPPTGTLYDGQRIIIRVTAAATIALTFNTSTNGYRAVGVVLPTTLSSGYTLYLGCIWNALAVRWDVLAVNTGV